METESIETVSDKNDAVENNKRPVGRPKGTKNDPNKQYEPGQRKPGRQLNSKNKTPEQKEAEKLAKKAAARPVGRPKKIRTEVKTGEPRKVGRPRKINAVNTAEVVESN